MARYLTKLKISEISVVKRGAGASTEVALRKSLDTGSTSHQDALEAVIKVDSVRNLAEVEIAKGASDFTEIEITKLWTRHAVVNRAVYGFGKGWSEAQCFAALLTKEPAVMRHIGLAKLTGWNGSDAERLAASKNASAIEAPSLSILERQKRQRLREVGSQADGEIPSAALVDFADDATSSQIGDEHAQHQVTDASDAAAQIAQIVEEKGRAAPWMTPAELMAYGEAMRRQVERWQARAAGVVSRVGKPRAAVAPGPQIRI